LRPTKLQRISENSLGDHFYITEDDRVFFFGEFFAYKGYSGGETNQLIANFKIKPSELMRNPARTKWKRQAIREVGDMLRAVIVPQQAAESFTWVPVPTSKIEDHVDHDTRLLDALKHGFREYDVDVRQLIYQTVSTESDHSSQSRLSKEDLMEILEVDHDLWDKKPTRHGGIVLFDDVLTSGKHYRCCVEKLEEHTKPDTKIHGVFVARRVSPNPLEDLDATDS
jgi:predicted amidophosphoribosyltransferase